MVRIKIESHSMNSAYFFTLSIGLFRCAFIAYKLKALLRPDITIAITTTTNFSGVLSQTIYHILQTDSSKLPPKKDNKSTQYLVVPRTFELNCFQCTEHL